MASSVYKFVVTDTSGNELAWLKSARGRSWSKYLSLPGEASFTLPINDTKATDTNIGLRNGLKIYRYNKVVWEGFIDGHDETDQDIVVHASGWLQIFASRLIKPTSAEISAGTGHKYSSKRVADQVMKDIIDRNNTDNDTGISTSTGDGASYPTDTDTITIEIPPYEPSLSWLVNLANAYKLEQEVVWNSDHDALVWKCTKEADAEDRGDIVFRYGQGGNIKDFQRAYTLNGMVNVLIAVPTGEGYDFLKDRKVLQDASSIAEYGFREEAVPFQYAGTDADNLTDLANEYLKKHKYPIEIMRFKLRPNAPFLGDWNLGDYVKFYIEADRIDIDDWRRIVGIEVKIDDKNPYESIEIITNPRRDT